MSTRRRPASAGARPYGRNAHAIPVTIVTGAGQIDQETAGAVHIKLDPDTHDHDGGACFVCAARGDVRALLFDLYERARLGLAEPFDSVVVDATGVPDVQRTVDALIPGASPAFGLRDHAVARNFALKAVIGSPPETKDFAASRRP